MSFARIASTYLVSTVVFFAVDMLWLGVVAKGFYRKQLGPLLSEQVNWPAAIAFYLLFIAGILLFVVFPSLDKGSLGRVVVLGALFGLVTYATYDLTNLATLRGFPPLVAAVMAWGMVLTAVVVLKDGATATERDLQKFVGSRLADMKVPRRILFMDEIPKGTTGKLQRIGLAQKLGLA